MLLPAACFRCCADMAIDSYADAMLSDALMIRRADDMIFRQRRAADMLMIRKSCFRSYAASLCRC